MKLHDFLNEIWDIAGANDKDVGVGMDMFLANVRNAGEEPSAPVYPGADSVDYAALYPHLAELEDSANDYSEAVKENYFDIVELRKSGDREGAVALIA